MRDHLDDDEYFMANYADVLTDAPLDDVVARFVASPTYASLLAVPPQSAFHVVDTDEAGLVTDIHSVSTMRVRENGGYFVMRRELLDHLEPGKDLVADTLTDLARRGKVLAYPYDGFWMPADTVKERVVLDQLAHAGLAPWELWRREREALTPTGAVIGAVPEGAEAPGRSTGEYLDLATATKANSMDSPATRTAAPLSGR